MALTDPGSWPEVIAVIDEHLKDLAALREEVSALRRRVAELAHDRDTWRARREGGW